MITVNDERVTEEFSPVVMSAFFGSWWPTYDEAIQEGLDMAEAWLALPETELNSATVSVSKRYVVAR